ncbi:MAG: hypothetical protein WBN52_15020 [Eudoraea sp.]|uniref:hypothetical protein n=1 Tax=Eudoraea sp. TaxID=1979955 RepID=UPI003C7322A5
MISSIVDTFTFSSIRQIAELIAWAMPALKITAIGTVLVWLALFLFNEIVEALQKLDRRAPPKDNESNPL